MLRMVASGSGELARRRVFMSELNYPLDKADKVKLIIDDFVEARLLVSDKDEEGEPYIEPTHDALIQGWSELSNWVKAEKNLNLQRRLTPDAVRWKSDPQPEYLWNADSYLDVLQKDVLKSPDRNWLNQVETEFVQQSIDRKYAIARRNRRNTIRVIAGLSALTIAAVIGAIFAFIGQRNAKIEQMLSSSQTSETLLQGQQLTFDALLSSIRAAKLLKQFIRKPELQQQQQVVTNLRKAVYSVREVQRLESPTGRVAEMAWQGDRVLIVTISPDSKTVRVWNSEDQQVIELPLTEGTVGNVQLSPNGQVVAIASEDGTIHLWDWQQQSVTSYKAHDGYVYNMMFSPSGKILASKGEQEFLIWNVEVNQIQLPKLQRQQPQGNLVDVGFTPEGKILGVVQVDQVTEARDVKIARLVDSSGKLLNQLEMPTPQNVEQAEFSPDGSCIILYSLGARQRSLGALEWCHNNGRGSDTESLSTDTQVAFSGDSSIRATAGSEDGMVRLKGVTITEIEEFRAHQGEIGGIDLNQDGSQLATVSSDGTVRVWSLSTSVHLSGKHLAGSVRTLAFQPNNDQLVMQSTDDGVLHWLDTTRTKVRTAEEPKPLFNTMQFSPNGETLAAIAEDGTLHLMDADGNSRNPPQAQGKFDPGSNLAFSPDSKQVAVLEANEWDVNSRRLPRKLAIVDVVSGKATSKDIGFGSIQKVIWRSFDNRLLLAVSGALESQDNEGEGSDRGVKLWDIETGLQVTAPLEANVVQELTDYSFDQNGTVMASGNLHGYVNLTYADGTTMTRFQAHNEPIKQIILSPDGASMATIADDGAATLWQIGDFDQLLSRGCDRLRDYLQNPEITDRALCNDP